MSINATVEKVTAKQAYDIALEAYCYFYPLVTMELTRRQTTNFPVGKKPGFGPMNNFNHIRTYPDADFKAVVRPNFDTLYSSCWLDLQKEPVVISVPDTNGRYYLLPMLDMWSDVFASPGWRTSGTGVQTYAIVQKGWTGVLPPDVVAIESPTPYAWIIGRTKTDGPADYAAVAAIQDQLQVKPLSQYGKTKVEAQHQINPDVDMVTPPLESVNAMTAKEYFALASELLKTIKPHATDWSTIARLNKIGFEIGKNFDLSALDQDIQKEIARGAQDALKLMSEKTKSLGRYVNGWAMNTDTVGVYGNYYLKRAIVAMIGLGANQPEDAVYPLNITDADGEQLLGEKNYVLHFDSNEIPPVDAFWSVTMYDASGFQVANELSRFAISSWMPLKFNSDGSLDIFIQHQNPGKEKETNWLPGPSTGVLGVTMRLYAPQSKVLNGDWNPPAIKKAK